MKLHEQTLKVLKNFSGINQSILIVPGTEIRTIAERTNILAIYESDDEFPQEFAIYDLNQFLGAVSLFKSPKLEFFESYVRISGTGASAVKYFFAEPSAITSAVDKNIKIKEWDISFELSAETLAEVQKSAQVLGLPHMLVVGEDDMIKLVITENAIDTSNAMEIPVRDWDGENFLHAFRIDFLKIIPGDYKVQITSKGISLWENKNGRLSYYISLETE
jgi:hypothetical protein